MTFEVEQGNPSVITLEGSALGGPEGMQFSAALGELLERTGGGGIVLDLSGVDIMNSSGLGMLVAASRSVTSGGGRIVLAGANENLRKLFSMTRLDSVFQTYESRAEAVEALSSR